MSWLSELKWSNRDEHLDAMLTGDAELDESVVSTYDRPQGFKFKLAQKIASMVGWSKSVSETTLFTETVTSEDAGAGFYIAPLDYTGIIDADELVVTFDGVEYTTTKQESYMLGGNVYGATLNDDETIDFSAYPFVIVSTPMEGSGYDMVVTETSGSHTISAVARVGTVTPNNDFKAAVKAVPYAVNPSLYITFTAGDDPYSWEVDKTRAEIEAAIAAGSPIFGIYHYDSDYNTYWTFVVPMQIGISFGVYGDGSAVVEDGSGQNIVEAVDVSLSISDNQGDMYVHVTVKVIPLELGS